MIDQSAADGGSVVASGQQTNILTVEVKSESSEILLGSMISAIEEHMGYFVQLNTKCAVWITQTPNKDVTNTAKSTNGGDRSQPTYLSQTFIDIWSFEMGNSRWEGQKGLTSAVS